MSNINQSGPNPYVAYRPAKPGLAQGGEPPLSDPYYGIGFGKAVSRFWRKAFVYRGRASRGEYWWSELFCLIVLFVCNAAASAADVSLLHVAGDEEGPIASWTSLICLVALIIPQLAVSVRRLHDANLRGWWVLLPLAFQIGYVASIGVAMLSGSSTGAAVGLLTTVLLVVAYLLSEIVLFILPPNPRGTRFDGPRTDRADGR